MIWPLPSRPVARPSRRLRSYVAAGVLLAVTAGCTTSGAGTGAKGYIAGDGAVTTIKAAERRYVPDLAGKTLAGKELDLTQLKGNIVVLNVWASWCGPCRSEADDLVAAADQLGPEGVEFVGINVRDSEVAALAFTRNHGVTYDSFFDPKGDMLLKFYGLLTLSSIPTTIVVDSKGRIAALIAGELTTSTLVGVVDDVLAES